MEYTLDELVTVVASQLAAAGLNRQVNGQVSAFPDRRTLRYYTTIGLMDRPETVRDRQAIYSDRHVSQAVAVKRLQASGLALARIQDRLAGLPPAEVEAIASGGWIGGRAAGGRFWAEAPAPAPAPAAAVAAPAPAPAPAAAAAAPAPAPAPVPVPAPAPVPVPAPAAAAAAPARALAPPPPGARPMLAIDLAEGATLLVATDHNITATDIAALRAAASALVEHLDQLSAQARPAAGVNRKDNR